MSCVPTSLASGRSLTLGTEDGQRTGEGGDPHAHQDHEGVSDLYLSLYSLLDLAQDRLARKPELWDLLIPDCA